METTSNANTVVVVDDNKKSSTEKSSKMGRLIAVYGLRFLIMTSICAHLNKGFGKAHLRQTFKLLLIKGYEIESERFDTMEAISLMPAALAPAFTIIAEFYPIKGYNIRYYLTFSLILGTLGLILATLLPLKESYAELCTFGIFLGQFAWTACDVFSQGLYSEVMSRHPETGPDLVTFVWIGQQIAGVAAALLGGFLVEYKCFDWWGDKSRYQLCNSLLIIPTALAIYPAYMNWLGEKKIDNKSEGASKLRSSLMKDKVITILSIMFGLFAVIFSFAGLVVKKNMRWGFMDKTNTMLLITAIVLVSEGLLAYRYLNSLIGKLVIFCLISRVTSMTITGASTSFYHYLPDTFQDGPHFSQVFVASYCGAAAYGASALALPLYNAVSKTMNYRTLYACLIGLAFFFKLTNAPLYGRWNQEEWGIGNHLWMIYMTITTRVTGLLYEMPQNLLMSRACPKSLGTTTIAMIGSAINFAFNANKFISGAICKRMGVDPKGKNASNPEEEKKSFDDLWMASIVICVVRVLPLAFLWLLPNAMTTEALFTPDSDFAKSALRIRSVEPKEKSAIKS